MVGESRDRRRVVQHKRVCQLNATAVAEHGGGDDGVVEAEPAVDTAVSGAL